MKNKYTLKLEKLALNFSTPGRNALVAGAIAAPVAGFLSYKANSPSDIQRQNQAQGGAAPLDDAEVQRRRRMQAIKRGVGFGLLAGGATYAFTGKGTATGGARALGAAPRPSGGLALGSGPRPTGTAGPGPAAGTGPRPTGTAGPGPAAGTGPRPTGTAAPGPRPTGGPGAGPAPGAGPGPGPAPRPTAPSWAGGYNTQLHGDKLKRVYDTVTRSSEVADPQRAAAFSSFMKSVGTSGANVEELQRHMASFPQDTAARQLMNVLMSKHHAKAGHYRRRPTLKTASLIALYRAISGRR